MCLGARSSKKFVDNPWTFGLAGCEGLSREGQEAARFEATAGGESGIRTHDTVARIPVFETGAFVRSAISPDVPSISESPFIFK